MTRPPDALPLLRAHVCPNGHRWEGAVYYADGSAHYWNDSWQEWLCPVCKERYDSEASLAAKPKPLAQRINTRAGAWVAAYKRPLAWIGLIPLALFTVAGVQTYGVIFIPALPFIFAFAVAWLVLGGVIAGLFLVPLGYIIAGVGEGLLWLFALDSQSRARRRSRNLRSLLNAHELEDELDLPPI